MNYAEVAVNVPIDETFYYSVPDELEVKRLQRVLVNFAGRLLTGFVMSIANHDEIKDKIEGMKIKPVMQVIEEDPVIDENTIETALWMSRFYLSPAGETLSAITPSARKPKKYSHSFSYTGYLAGLSKEQETAFDKIQSGIGKGGTYLIHGVTGSGKTEIYKHLVKKMLSLGKSSIILIPEISLTPQTLERFYESFGNEVSIYHSKLTQSERFGEWLRALHGQARVIIGPRSAVFMPVRNLGLIIIDEEHESSYKSGNSPRYHARQVANFRAKKEKALLVLGSATPQIESYYFALNRTFQLIELLKRYGDIKLPSVKISDLRDEKTGNIITAEFLNKIIETVERGKQVLIFLNRRGFAPVMLCRDCGHNFPCPDCNLALTYHKISMKLICHHCGFALPLPLKCPSCGGANLAELGSGTEKLEGILKNQFPSYRIERMDLDSTRGRNSYIDILKRVKNKEVDILVGTQMVAKGHDIAGIQFVGVVLPDIIMNIPDFRSVERAFVLLTQVIGRAGRREERGEALIETYLPDHYAVKMAAEQDYKSFFNMEIEKRKLFEYPPFVRLGRVVFRCADQSKVMEFTGRIREWIDETRKSFGPGLKILGPVTCPLEKLKNNYRYHIIIKSRDAKEINGYIRSLKEFAAKLPGSRFIYMEIDIDPVSLV